MTDLLAEFLAFAAPDLHDGIDWATAPVFLDKEFQAIARQAAVGPRAADLVVQLRLRSGATTLLVLHVEVQGQPQDDFAARMFTYYALLHLRLWRQRRRRGSNRATAQPALILGLAILTDDRESWRPGPYEARDFGLGVRYDYRVVKLLDLRVRGSRGRVRESVLPDCARLAQLPGCGTTRGRPDHGAARRLARPRPGSLIVRSNWRQSWPSLSRSRRYR